MVSKWRADTPFNELPLLPPDLDLETRAILKQCIPARAALAELKQAAERIPNQGMLINTMPLLEAQASSEIENIATTSDRLFQYRHNAETADPATKEALRYCRIQNVVEAKIAERQAATRYLKQLTEIGVLEERIVGREKLFLHPKFLKLLIRESNSFAEYA